MSDSMRENDYSYVKMGDQPRRFVLAVDITAARRRVLGDCTSGVSGPTHEDVEIAAFLNGRICGVNDSAPIAPAEPLVADAASQQRYCELAACEILKAERAAHATQQAKGQRVFEAVVYAFEGKGVPDDLHEHGMVRRALKFRATQRVALQKFLRHAPNCASVGGDYPAEWRHADAATCNCGLARLLGAEPGER